MSSSTKGTVLILGGGLAGLAAATALAPRGFAVTLLESRNRLGGRASSFQDAATAQLVDNCQHVSMGCCTNFAHFCQTLGLDQYIQPQRYLYFLTPDRRLSRFFADRFPAPLHLARSFLSAHYLTWSDKLRIAYGLLQLQRSPEDADSPFSEWLTRNKQNARTIDRFWGVVLISALNETPDRMGLRYARKVFIDGFLRHRRGFEVYLPTVPLGRLYGEELQQWLREHSVRVCFQHRVKSLSVASDTVDSVQLLNGDRLQAEWYISALPFERLLDILPQHVIEQFDYFDRLKNLQTSPITSVHLWFDRPVLTLPHAVLIEGTGQWVFNRGQTESGAYYLQVVVSAARQFRGSSQEEILHRIVEELRHVLPNATAAVLLRHRVVTEHAATFSAVPGVDRWRPPQVSPISNLLVAGDWTATGWPATMEGAVRSGYLAAEGLLRKIGLETAVLQSDL